MSLLSWSWFFLAIYVALMVWFGYLGSRRVASADDFAVARKGYGPFVLALAFASTAASGAVVPELLGVVKVPGRSGSAIFTTGGNSLSTGVGEPIGSSGWILEQVQADRVVIRQGSDTLQLSLGR